MKKNVFLFGWKHILEVYIYFPKSVLIIIDYSKTNDSTVVFSFFFLNKISNSNASLDAVAWLLAHLKKITFMQIKQLHELMV